MDSPRDVLKAEFDILTAKAVARRMRRMD